MSGSSPADLRRRFVDRQPAVVTGGLRRLVEAAGAQPLFLVAGALRDLMLNRPISDVDLALEGDAIELARRSFPESRITAHKRFGTATVHLGPTRIDLAMTRAERYARPGALPSVTPASIQEDLLRRDFTINAMALRLTGEADLLDPAGGLDDLSSKVIRVLHDASFQDDATRIFRALRYGGRLGFALDRHTGELLRRDVESVTTIGGERLRRELELVFDEPEAGEILEACARHEVLRHVHPALRWDGARSSALRAPPGGIPPDVFGFALLAAEVTAGEAESIAARLRLKREQAAAVRGIPLLNAAVPLLSRREAKPSGVVVVLDRCPPASVAAFADTSNDRIAAELARRYLDEWRWVKPHLRGDDLLRMGVPAGPQVQRGLQLIRAAKLDGSVTDEADERILALRFAKSIRDAEAMGAQIEFHDNGA